MADREIDDERIAGRRRSAAVLLAAAVALGACGQGASSGEAFDALRRQAEGASIDRQYDSVSELTESIRQRHDESGADELVVVGRFTDVEPGVSFVFEVVDDGADRIVVQYGDPKAEVSTVHLTFQASETLAPHSETGPRELTIGVLFDPSVPIEAIEKDFLALGESVVFLQTSDAFDDEPGTYVVMENSLLIGELTKDDIITFPLLDDDDPLVEDRTRLGDLVAAP